MSARSPDINTWSQLAGALARRAGVLRARWVGLGETESAADARAQETICARLVSWLSKAGATPIRRKSTRRAGPSDVGLRRFPANADVNAVWRDFTASCPGMDPISSLYEHFLAAYDPRRRMRQGVFFTPRPVAAFIVRAVHECLQRQFGLADGLAASDTARNLRLLDPAAGTGVFLIEIIDLLHHTLRAQWRAAGHGEAAIQRLWSDWVSRILPGRLVGYELMPAACALANLNVALKLRATGCRNVDGHAWVRAGNSLEMLVGSRAPETLPVIVGNPPYAAHSRHHAAALNTLLADYKHGVAETNVNALSDDYVKFFRLAHDLIVRAGAGVIGFVTNHSFLEGVTHRRMRELLLRDFDDLQVVDLHGNILRRHEAPARAGDENIFAIQSGVAITILARTSSSPRPGRLRRADLWGTRQSKFDRLSAGPARLPWRQPALAGPYFFFRAPAGANHDEYHRWPSLAEVFTVFSSGIKFRKDGLLVKNHFTRADAEEMLRDVAALPARELTAKYGFRETADWRLEDKRGLFAHWRPEDIVEVLYRPFDVRYAFYPLDRAGRIIVRGDARVELMRHVMTVPNIGLIFNRQVVGAQVTHFLVSRRPVSHGCFYLGNKGQDYFAPLYLADGTRPRPNLTPAFMARLAAALQRPRHQPRASQQGGGRLARFRSPQTPAPESVLHYLYAVLHCPAYRARYAETLKVDFPRVPLPGSARLFTALGRLGADLVGLHLLEDDYAEASWTRAGKPNPLHGPGPLLIGANTPTVASGYPQRCDGRVYLNPACWFAGVPDDVWAFPIGGYRICEKWLKDRGGRRLSDDDIHHYGRMVRSLEATLRLMARIDALIARHGGWPEAFTDRK